MGASASDARADEEVDDVQDDIPRSPCLSALRARRASCRTCHRSSPLSSLSRSLSTYFSLATGSLAGDDDEPDDDEQPDESDETVANHAKQASLSHPVRFVGSKNIKLSVECELPLSEDSLAYVKLGMLSHGNLNERRVHGGTLNFSMPAVIKCVSHLDCAV